MSAVTDAEERCRLAAAEYDAASDEFDAVEGERKTELAWKCFRLHRNYREAFTVVMKAIMAEVETHEVENDNSQAATVCAL